MQTEENLQSETYFKSIKFNKLSKLFSKKILHFMQNEENFKAQCLTIFQNFSQRNQI